MSGQAKASRVQMMTEEGSRICQLQSTNVRAEERRGVRTERVFVCSKVNGRVLDNNDLVSILVVVIQLDGM